MVIGTERYNLTILFLSFGGRLAGWVLSKALVIS